DQPEGIEQRLHQPRLAENGQVIRQPDPGRRTDTVPAEERVLHRQRERLQHEQSVHRQRRQHEQPADDRLSADPRPGDPPTVPPICRALSLVATQLKKAAAQSAFFALSAMPYVSGADIAASVPLASDGGKTKKPTLPDRSLS